MKVFVICTVRGAGEKYRKKLEKYVAGLEDGGAKVHLPHRDTNQDESGLNICRQNCQAIKDADEIHIFYNHESQGTHFDMGSAFAYGKKLVVVENIEYGDGKSFPRMLDEWG